MIYDQLLPETREALHQNAAGACAERGEYTAAAYHFIKAGRAEQAVELWYEHRREEINQGQAGTALRLFADVSRNKLTAPTLEWLVLLRTELRLLVGEFVSAREDLRTTLWETPLLHSRGQYLEGELQEQAGDLAGALETYQSGLRMIEQFVERDVIHFHKQLSWVHYRNLDLNHAWQEARLARYVTEAMHAKIKYALGEYDEAQSYYASAIQLTREINHPKGEADMCMDLGWLLARLGQFGQAHEHFDCAEKLFNQIGRIEAQANVKVNQATAYILAGEPERSKPLAEQALLLYERINSLPGKTDAMLCLAQGYLGMGDIDRAEQYAHTVAQQEDPMLLAESWRVLAEVQLQRGQYAAAESLLQMALKTAEQQQDSYLAAYCWRSLSVTFNKMGQADRSQQARDTAIALFTQLHMPHEVAKTQHT